MSDSKRKANGSAAAAAHELDDRAAKRRRAAEEVVETAETTTKLGMEFIDHIKKVQDKTKRFVATNFLTLPSRKEFPEYYRVIKTPIALDTIEGKLQRREFATMTDLESHIKRMVSNAKEFNERGSEVYEDAERLRKALSNFMTRSNPALKAAGFQGSARPPRDQKVETPTPTQRAPRRSIGGTKLEESEEEEEEEEYEQEEQTPASKRRGRPPRNPPTAQVIPSGPLTDQQYLELRFDGMTFQQAQEKIIAEMIRHQDSEDDEFVTYEPFIVLPSRALKDYYQLISHPVSLKSFQKTVKGQHGRNAIPGVTPFKTWSAFEEEASYIWTNAWQYNEDGSEISKLAKSLQKFFNKLVADAKKHVSDAQPKIKLKVGGAAEPAPKITLRMGAAAASLDQSPAPINDIPNGAASPGAAVNRRLPLGSRTSSTPVPANLKEQGRSLSGSVPSPSPSASVLVKNEDGSRQQPVGSATPGPHPTQPAAPQVNGAATAYSNAGITASSVQGAAPSPLPLVPAKPSFDSKWRQPGKGLSDALIKSLSLSTHPGLNIISHFRMEIPASPILAQQSVTINLPSTHYYLQIKPALTSSLLERQYKLFVTSGTQRLHAVPALPGHAVDPRNPMFETRLLPGVNRIEVEIIAALPKGTPKPSHGQDIELEKFTVFANLMKS